MEEDVAKGYAKGTIQKKLYPLINGNFWKGWDFCCIEPSNVDIFREGALSELCHLMRHASPSGVRGVLNVCFGIGLRVISCVLCPFTYDMS